MGFDIKQKLTVDKTLAEQGVWCPIGEGAKIKVAKSGNPKYRAYLNQLMLPYSGAIKSNTLDKDVMNSLVIKAYAKYILLDWEGIEEEGKPVPYSVEKAEEYLKIEAFFDLVYSFANDLNLFQKETEEVIEKNLKTGSCGEKNMEKG